MSADGQGDLPPFAGKIEPGPDPMRLSSVKATGIAASTGRPGEMIDVATRYWSTSESHAFHQIVTSMVDLFGQSATRDRKPVNLMAAIKALIAEIEGILQDAHIAAVGNSAKQGS